MSIKLKLLSNSYLRYRTQCNVGMTNTVHNHEHSSTLSLDTSLSALALSTVNQPTSLEVALTMWLTKPPQSHTIYEPVSLSGMSPENVSRTTEISCPAIHAINELSRGLPD
jgi:hypothetical protein